MEAKGKIIYTITDEAPALATFSLLPIIKAYIGKAGIEMETRDISLSARILAKFSEFLTEEQKHSDDLSELGALAKLPEANIIKLPNISASIPQMKECIRELQINGYSIPDYPESPSNEAEASFKELYDSIKGSAVNPVLREGNSDRRCSPAVKAYSKANPHSMGTWSPESKSRVTSMKSGDFFANEQSVTVDRKQDVRIELHTNTGDVICLKDGLTLTKGEVIDTTYMCVETLRNFLKEAIEYSKKGKLLFSLHMKATMMKVSDPIIFGHAVTVYFESVFDKYGSILNKIGVNQKNGLGDIISNLDKVSKLDKESILSSIESAIKDGPDIAMVDSDKGITNLHVPSDIIIDASMPAAIRTSGMMWNPKGQLQDTNFVIPDRSYAGVYSETIDFCKEHGAFDPSTMGSVSNVGLMAQKAEEYGSHDKTFEISQEGLVKVISQNGVILSEHNVSKGDIWRACQVKDEVVNNWVELAVERARETNTPAIFFSSPSTMLTARLRFSAVSAESSTFTGSPRLKSCDENESPLIPGGVPTASRQLS